MVFNKLRQAFKKISTSIAEAISTRSISEKELEGLLEEAIVDLVESDVSFEAAQHIVEEVKNSLVGRKVPRFSKTKEIVEKELKRIVLEMLQKAQARVDIVSDALKRKPGDPLRIVFFGVNGVGKTTTIAKFAYMFKKAGITPVIVAADTYRAGAQEQLRIHAEKLGVPFIGGRYGADPASVAYDAIQYASSRGYRVVLIDTAGRMHTDTDLMNELRKIVRVVKPHYKVLVLDALTGNDALEQARFFEEAVGVDVIVLTKLDADTKGGTAISVAYGIGKPILFVGTGQRYEDLKPFNPADIVERIFRED